MWEIALPSVILAGCSYIWFVRKMLGSLPVESEDVAFDEQKYSHLISWDSKSMFIHGKPTILTSGEFHYWRLPDKSRWEPILRMYKMAGLNCIRIYFHVKYCLMIVGLSFTK